MKKTQLILAAAGLMGASGLEAQTKKPTESKEHRKAEESCTTEGGVTKCHIYRMKEDSTLIKRAAIGVSVQTTGTKRDTLGVFISRVTPDGPAEKAGIVEGDRIAAINGIDLRVAAADVDDSYTAGIASHRLTRELNKLAPGASVNLRVWSGGRIRDVPVTTARASDLMKSRGAFGMAFPRIQGMPGMQHMELFRENMEPLRMLRTPRTIVTPRAISPSRIRVVPGTPGGIYFDDEVVREAPALAPSAPAKPAKISSTIVRSSI